MQHIERFQSSSSPWRAATIAVGAIAVVELVGLLVLGGVRLAPAQTHASAPVRAAAKPAHTAPPTLPSNPLRPRSHVRVLVLNGNGVAGAAAAEASTLRVAGYRIGGATNAPAHAGRSLVMYAPGWAKEARRLARDTSVRSVAPLDGLKPSQLRGSKLVLLLGT
ncbi:MAG TPA: LytR C-terminal domain-containing protein [Gaiellaceae bacterium]|nr:LytR C-terminal domain-containing protein [Gaiellaceae bacterium]